MKKLFFSKDFIIPFAVGAGLVVGMGMNSYMSYGDLMRALCDGFFAGGMLVAGWGGLVYVRNEGIFDGLSYSFANLFVMRSAASDTDSKKRETYTEFKARKSKARKSPMGLLVAGGIYLAISGIVLVIYSFG